MSYPNNSIRTASAADAERIAALAIQVFLDTYATEGVRPDLANEAFAEYGTDVFARRLSEHGKVFYLAEWNTSLVGFAEVLRKTAASPIPGISGTELVRLYVQPQAQGKGIGRALLLCAESCASEEGSVGVWLSAWEHNARAIAFYRRQLYEDVGYAEYIIQGNAFGNRIFFKSVANEA